MSLLIEAIKEEVAKETVSVQPSYPDYSDWGDYSDTHGWGDNWNDSTQHTDSWDDSR